MARTPGVVLLSATAVFAAALFSASGAAAQVAEEPAWLDQVNAYRAAAGVTPFTEKQAYSEAAAQRAAEIVVTDDLRSRQDPTGEWCTSDSDPVAGAQQSAFPYEISDSAILDLWMGSAFQGILTLNPMLVTTGFGSSHQPESPRYKTAAVMCLAGLTSDRTYLRYPVMSPGPESSTHLLTANEFENPSPLTACPGYNYPVGTPISIQLQARAELTETSLLEDGREIEHCAFDRSSYTNDDANLERLAHMTLDLSHAAVIIPKKPLTVGSTYTAAMTFGATTHTWSFTAGTETVWRDTVGVGSQGADTLAGTMDGDSIYMLGGDDEASGGAGDDLVYAGVGNDVASGAGGADMVNGEDGNDLVVGGGGNDRLFGRSGADKLKGGRGFDRMDAGGGKDVCTVDSKKEKLAAKNCEKVLFRRPHS